MIIFLFVRKTATWKFTNRPLPTKIVRVTAFLKLNFWATPHMKAHFQIFLLVYYVFSFGPLAE